MNAITSQMYDIPGIHQQFFGLVLELKSLVARHVLAAWDGETAEEINDNLEEARTALKQIAELAGPVGYSDLRVTAQHCEAQISAHLEGPYADLAICPGEIIWFVDVFVETCDNIIV